MRGSHRAHGSRLERRPCHAPLTRIVAWRPSPPCFVCAALFFHTHTPSILRSTPPLRIVPHDPRPTTRLARRTHPTTAPTTRTARTTGDQSAKVARRHCHPQPGCRQPCRLRWARAVCPDAELDVPVGGGLLDRVLGPGSPRVRCWPFLFVVALAPALFHLLFASLYLCMSTCSTTCTHLGHTQPPTALPLPLCRPTFRTLSVSTLL